MCLRFPQWGQNSGHIGVPLESIPGFVLRLQAQYRQATGQSPGVKAKSPGSGGPKSAISKGNKKKQEKKKQEPKKPASLEDLDADLMNYTAARGGEDAAMGAEPAAAATGE